MVDCFHYSPEPEEHWAVGRYKRFLPIAQSIAQQSKDPSTKVGAVVVATSLEIKSAGWNGAPRGCAADEDERYASREEKLQWVVHAEANAIANAARIGVSLLSSVLIVTHMPCMACARLIVQAGIFLVLCPHQPDYEARWAEDVNRTRRLFSECGVQLVMTP